ncbi:hypothetical protein CCACVL1_23106 [Corchorus capsularis]|uniref:Uncharacterized protein n=1 Tax=Corchorus capsularis TaxID=210143 RepID=A0A1R3GV62_COCAP|nr:hypothetical protein CCACVL1_23106 [Corchorus capsularis]
MESKRQVGSSSSFIADLFGSKDSSSSTSKRIFSSIFAPPSTAGGRNSSSSKLHMLIRLQPITYPIRKGTQFFRKKGWNHAI